MGSLNFCSHTLKRLSPTLVKSSFVHWKTPFLYLSWLNLSFLLKKTLRSFILLIRKRMTNLVISLNYNESILSPMYGLLTKILVSCRW